jgi:hypothetical protein
MAVGFPVKDDYATGDVLTAANMNDFAGTLNTVPNVVGGFAAGKNKIINGDFNINQRAFTSTTTTNTYGFDRWVTGIADGTVTCSAQSFTPGAAPVAGYEGINFARVVTTGQTATSAQARLRQQIEDVRTFAGQTVTASFWAKAGTGTPNVAIGFQQSFGSGGSSAVVVTGQKFAITTSWVRYSKTFNIPSVSGKTIGAGSLLSFNIWTSAGADFNTNTDSLGIQSATIDIWGVQVEAGSIATPFQTATGTIQGELAACQRYYWRGVNNGAYTFYGSGGAISTTAVEVIFPLPVTMRIQPTTVDFSTLAVQPIGGGTITAITTVTSAAGTQSATLLGLSGATGLTSGAAYRFITNNSTSGFLGLSAEL